MANIYGVVALDTALSKGYSDFVQHTNPLKEGLLRLALNEPQTLQVTIGYLQNQAENMPLAYNSLIGLISVREPELVNLLIQLNYRESRESVNSLIQLNSVDSTESANSLIMSKTCTAGTSPNVLMKSDFVSFPSGDDTHKTQKEKGSVRSAALWDDCSFNHEENHYSTDLDNNADLHLYGTLSPAQTLYTEIIGTQNLQVTKRYSQNNAEIIGAVGSANDISSAQLSGSGLAFLRWRRCNSSRATLTSCFISSPALVPISSTLVRASSDESKVPSPEASTWRRIISPCIAVTINPALLSPSRLTDSIDSKTSWGTRTVVNCDLAFLLGVAITETPFFWCVSVYTKKEYRKTLKCVSFEYKLKHTLILSVYELAKPAGACDTHGLLTTNDSMSIEVVMLNHTTIVSGYTPLGEACYV